jgi:type I restriction enzyme S subunit
MTVGKLAITTEEMLSNEAIAHLKIKENSNFSTEFVYLFLKDLDFNSLGSTSSIVTAINSTMIKVLEILIPEDQVMQKFNAIVKPIFAKLKNNNSQIQTLSTLRDTLLPKLMKGEIRIKEFNS